MPGAAPLFGRLKDAAGETWSAFVAHPFVRSLADGSLPEAAFRHYLIQDYLFLIHFARAYGLAAFKADTLEDIRHAAAGLGAMVGQEMALHVGYCRSWGLDEAQMAAAEEADATMAYTRYVLERGLAGDLLDLAVALAPCIVGYAEIGRQLAADPATKRDGNPYTAWIETYAGDDYQAVARDHIAHMDRLMARRGSPERLPALKVTFRQATRLEAAFWQMGLDAAS
ncbi:MAG: thiaminase II [Rhodospirillales bacterium]|nr:MAG: thiaminase II [Rhodospirillales bacterium]